MANYNVTQCVTNQQWIISASTLSLGDVIIFKIGEDPFCGVVGDVTSVTPHDGLYDQTSTNCCQCIIDTLDRIRFKFIKCDTLEEINIEGGNFCSQYGIPSTGLTYEIQLGSESPFCATFVDLAPSGVTNYSYVSGPYTNCEICKRSNPTTTSAGTESTICVICCPCGSTGSTVTSVSPPHPTWTDSSGNAVVLLNAITLGGPNGLNS